VPFFNFIQIQKPVLAKYLKPLERKRNIFSKIFLDIFFSFRNTGRHVMGKLMHPTWTVNSPPMNK
jgi:hypothetical protein